MSTIRELLHAAHDGSNPEARHEAEILLGHVLQRSRAWMFAHANDVLDADSRERFEQLLAARRRGEPVAYLIGQRGFWTLDLAVTPDVLIPRPETELLVELALERIPVDADFAIADLGTGSGAIALAIASERPRARILATDASSDALALARANAERVCVSNVTFSQGDWYAALGQLQFRMIVSNPPYIRDQDEHLGQGDLRYEPLSALASGVDGLDSIRVIVAEAHRHLADAGWLLIEHGYDQGIAVRELLTESEFVEVQTWRDIGGNERISGGRLV